MSLPLNLILTLNTLDLYKDYKRYIHILNCILESTWPMLMKLTLEWQYILSVLHSQYHACWCTGDFKSQCISRHGTDPQSQNIQSPASKELIINQIFPLMHTRIPDVLTSSRSCRMTSPRWCTVARLSRCFSSISLSSSFNFKMVSCRSATCTNNDKVSLTHRGGQTKWAPFCWWQLETYFLVWNL